MIKDHDGEAHQHQDYIYGDWFSPTQMICQQESLEKKMLKIDMVINEIKKNYNWRRFTSTAT